MSDVMTVENTEMQIREYNGQRVVTFKDIDRVHERKSGTAYRNFNRNKKYFIEGEDYMKVCSDEIRRSKIFDVSNKTRGNITLITETGYLMIVKSFTDDLSWSVQRQLVNNYFEKRVVQNVVDETPKIEKYELKVAINPDWYERNRGRLYRICERGGTTYKKLYHKILKEVGEYYDLEEASIIFYNEVGHYPNYAIDIVSYFRELGEMADKILDRLDD
ncbi:ORF6N domain-containing protein [Faecalicatena acetigenes]|uniref:ORF6N domain-containing protein n=1 Tax=Faecalicatena acetigenes TaxID=2981790 RepID=A0ABT2TCJ5_9FIRM|nr:ORF6N domain-containing protein [Faecalicatena acetigenes]MCU6748015.1 ORF6N domain-containing protein [Faecalicatena acetigenes]